MIRQATYSENGLRERMKFVLRLIKSSDTATHLETLKLYKLVFVLIWVIWKLILNEKSPTMSRIYIRAQVEYHWTIMSDFNRKKQSKLSDRAIWISPSVYNDMGGTR